jgi:hypothetical protein
MAKSQVWTPVLHLNLKNKVFAYPPRSSNRRTGGKHRSALISHINEKKVNDMAPRGAVFPSAQL